MRNIQAAVEPEPILVESFELDPDEVNVIEGEDTTIEITNISPNDADDKTFTVDVDDNEIATVSISGTTITVVGVSEGSTTVIVTSADGGEVSQVAAVDVEAAGDDEEPVDEE